MAGGVKNVLRGSRWTGLAIGLMAGVVVVSVTVPRIVERDLGTLHRIVLMLSSGVVAVTLGLMITPVWQHVVPRLARLPFPQLVLALLVAPLAGSSSDARVSVASAWIGAQILAGVLVVITPPQPLSLAKMAEQDPDALLATLTAITERDRRKGKPIGGNVGARALLVIKERRTELYDEVERELALVADGTLATSSDEVRNGLSALHVTVLALMGRGDEAEARLDELVRLPSLRDHEPKLRLELATSVLATADARRSLAIVRRLLAELEAEPDPALYDQACNVGAWAIAIGDLTDEMPQADAWSAALVAARPDDGAMRDTRGAVLAVTGRPQEALEHLMPTDETPDVMSHAFTAMFWARAHLDLGDVDAARRRSSEARHFGAVSPVLDDLLERLAAVAP